MKYRFSDEDIIRLKDNADYVQIFDRLGIEYKKSTNYIDFLCPFHNDTHFGSAKVDLYKKKCTCFACNEQYSPLDLIAKIENLNLHEALIELADLEGVLYEFEINEEKHTSDKPKPRLTAAQKKLLGFEESDVKSIEFTSATNIPNSIYDTKSKKYLIQKNTVLSWNYLYLYHPKEYASIITNRCEEVIEEVNKQIQNTKIFLSNYQSRSNWYYEGVLSLLNNKLKEIKKIQNYYGKDRAQ